MAFNPDPYGQQKKANAKAKASGHFDPYWAAMVGVNNKDLTLFKKYPKQEGYFSSGTATKPGPYTQVAKARAKDTPEPKAKPKPKTPAASAIIDALLNPADMANKEFAPQFALLDQLSQQATARYGKAGRDVSGMYAALANQFRGQEKDIKAQYGANANALTGQLNAATGTLASDYAKSRDELASRAARLGVADTVPQLDKESANQQNQTAGLLAAINANYQGANTANQSSDVSYNRDTANTTNLMGADAAQAFQAKLMAALDEYSNKRLDLQGQKGAAENKYGIEIAGQQNAQEKARADAALGAAKLKQQMDIAKLQFAPKTGGEPNYKSMPADVAMSTLAQKLYPNVGDSTRHNAIQAILDTVQRGYQGDRQWNNVADFLRDLASRNPGAMDYNQLQALGRLYYEKIAGGADKPYG